MRQSRKIVLASAAAAIAFALVFVSLEGPEPTPAPASASAPPQVAAPPDPPPLPAPEQTPPAPASAAADSQSPNGGLIPGQYGYDNDFRTDYSDGYWLNADIEELRGAIYDRQIDRLDRLHLLDDLVEIGDADPRELWGTDWGSADDFKDEDNGFALLKGEDGRFYFVPDAQTMRQNSLLEPLGAYEYHEDGEVFVQKTHYYGKPMMSALKFLREDVLVMMIVSGDKVDLNIYEQAHD